jgi:hypothetical protein
MSDMNTAIVGSVRGGYFFAKIACKRSLELLVLRLDVRLDLRLGLAPHGGLALYFTFLFRQRIRPASRPCENHHQTFPSGASAGRGTKGSIGCGV